MGGRFRDSTTWPAYLPALVRCPRCSACARVVRLDDAPNPLRLTCPACVLVHGGRGLGLGGGDLLLASTTEERTWRDPDTREISTWPVAEDEVVELWLRTPCCGEVLWATNEEHLAYLEDVIGASLRERPEARISPMGRRWVGKGLSSKLPEWMKAAKHRDEVLAGLARLRRALADADVEG